MTDEAQAAPATTPDLSPPLPHAAAGQPARRSTLNPWLPAAVVGVVLLLVGLLAWRSLSSSATQLAGLQGRLDTIDARIGRLEARPPPPDLGPMDQRLAAVEQRTRPLEQRLAALENKPPPQASLDAASQRALADIAGRMDNISARQDQLGTQEQADMAKLADQVNGLQQVVGISAKAGETVAAQASKASSDVQVVARNAARLAQLQTAGVALEAGQPLGTIAGAPPALARFATDPPPTQASLRLSFDAAARAAHDAGQPAPENAPFLARMWDRAQSGVTVREGGRVIAGDTVTGVLEAARHRLDAGDLAGAVAALDGLSGPAASAMASWRAQAQALLDARLALLTVAHG